MRRSPSVWLVLGLVASIGLGCANLTAIQEFADASADSVQYRAIVRDYVEFPKRQERYAPPKARKRLEEMGRRRAEQEPALLLQQAIVEEYMDALGTLAADEAVDYDEEIDRLAASIEKAKFGTADEAQASAAVVNLVARAATDGWRQHKLKVLIERSNAPFQTVVGALKKLTVAFDETVEQERAGARSYYTGLSMRSRDPAGRAALEEWQELRMGDIAVRQQAVRDYATILAKIAAGHQKLYEERDDLCNQDVLRQVQEYARELRATYKALKRL